MQRGVRSVFTEARWVLLGPSLNLITSGVV